MINVKVFCNGVEADYKEEKGENLLKILQKNGYNISAGCGGNGKCGKCKVTYIVGDIKKEVLSCRQTLTEDCSVYVSETVGGGLTSGIGADFARDKSEGFGVALDIGTTTLAFYLCDRGSGKQTDVFSCINPQQSFGADVISRINACMKGATDELCALIRNKTNFALEYFINKHNLNKISQLFVTGNATMLHLFAGVDPSPIGVYPYSAPFLERKNYHGKDIGISADEVTLLPSFSAYVGADIVCGGIACDIIKGNNLLIDIGTNGEMLLSRGGKLFSTSTAAGPAFEGAGIECGMGGVSGAICKVGLDGAKIIVGTVDNVAPTGICGAGLTDAIAAMLDHGIIDETGAFTQDGDRFYLTDKIYVSQKDVRQFQLAKSAICAGAEVLLKTAEISAEDIDNLFISGGLGYYMNKKSALRVGLIPEKLGSKIVVAGNTAGIGAKMCMLSEEKLLLADELAIKAENTDLSASPFFLDEYTENMLF